MTFEDYISCDAIELARLVRTGQTSATELAEVAIARAEAVNPSINAIAKPLFERAREAAPLAAGPFAGVPFATKDLNHALEGVALENGSRAYAGDVQTQTAELPERYEAAGLVIMCTSTSPEFGLAVTTESNLHGPTRNPWNLGRSAGGSSGGAAALVAAGVVPAAHATDGGGSIRIPAACCGLFGLKPSRGRTPVGTGRTEGWSGLTCAHVVSRSVRDSAALLDETRGAPFGARVAEPEGKGPFVDCLKRDPAGLRIAVQRVPFTGSQVDPACLAALDDAMGLCRELGHEVEEVEPVIDDLTSHLLVLIGTHTAAALDERSASRGQDVRADELETVTAAFAETGRASTGLQILAAERAFMDAAITMAELHRHFDVLLTPVLARPPAPIGSVSLDLPVDEYALAMQGYSPFTAYQNMTGQPAMSVPLHWSSEGLPIGVQFAGRLGAESDLFALAGQLERARPWFDRRPAL